MINPLLAIACGGALGAVLRFLVSSWIAQRIPHSVPLGTLAVNTLGALLIGFLYVLISEKMIIDESWRPVLVAGFLGAFTTFSAFSLELVQMLSAGEAGTALLYIMLSVILCVALAWVGMQIGRAI